MKLVYKDSGHDVLVGDPVTLEGVTCAVTRWRDDVSCVIVTADNGMWRQVTAEEIGLRWVEENADLSTPRDRWPPKVRMESTPTGESWTPKVDWVPTHPLKETLEQQEPVRSYDHQGREVVFGTDCPMPRENPHETFKRQHLTRYEVPVHPLDGEPDHRLPAQRVAFNATDYIGFSEEQIALIRRGFMAALDQCWELEKQERNFK